VFSVWALYDHQEQEAVTACLHGYKVPLSEGKNAVWMTQRSQYISRALPC
jgi:hypothetical protein